MGEAVHGPLAQTPTPSAGMQKIVTKHSFFCLKGKWKRGRHVVVVRIRSDRVCSQNFVFTAGVVAFTIAITLGGQVLADRFELANGETIEGTLLNPNERPRRVWLVRSSDGTSLQFDADAVTHVTRETPVQKEFHKIVSEYPDTIEGQWKLAEWCQEKKLEKERHDILEHMLELDPDHVEARRLLGYSRIDGKWHKREQLMAERGYSRYRGTWKTAQEIELSDRAEQTEVAQKNWIVRLKKLRMLVDKPQSSDSAAKEIREISDRHAVGALMLGISKEPAFRVRSWYLESLSRIATQEAFSAIVQIAIDHPDPETRLSATERLIVLGPHQAASYAVASLASEDSARINRAAELLGRLGVSSAVDSLVNVLITVHTAVVSDGNSEGSTNATFTPSGGGLSMGGGAKRIKVESKNEAVLAALVKLTSVNFEWNPTAWRSWMATRQSPANCDFRRN